MAGATKETNRAATDYREKQARIKELLEELEGALWEHSVRQAREPRSWGWSGDLGHAAVVRFLQG